MQEELMQFTKMHVWELCIRSEGVTPISTKWVFRNKTDERGIVIKNKARLVVQGYFQEEGIDYEETFSPVARLEAIILFLAYASTHNIKVFQMNVKGISFMVTLKKKCMQHNHQDLKTHSIQNMSTD
ncbi:putative mitochondrial protein AtMg00820 [Bidens hawaiensis]|uniref:putative mitochondrial protein AtMg00820 n=1 Tax=Bidens hawaiensis TaxID=980011 RepID=UPI0040494207